MFTLGHYAPESRAVVIPLPAGRTRDAEVRRIHRESIASEKKGARNFILTVALLTVLLGLGASVVFEYLKEQV